MGNEWGMTANGYRVPLWDDENVLKFIVMVARFYEYMKKILNCKQLFNMQIIFLLFNR